MVLNRVEDISLLRTVTRNPSDLVIERAVLIFFGLGLLLHS